MTPSPPAPLLDGVQMRAVDAESEGQGTNVLEQVEEPAG